MDGLDLTVPKGSVFGILGPNGSGKSTTLGMLLGVINPLRGSYSWFGRGSGHQVRKRIGSILEAPAFYHYLSADQNLNIVCEIKGVNTDRVDAVLDRVGLAARRSDPFRNYSLGMKQRLAIASALLSDPEVLILDEPTNGLDPQGIAEIRNLIIDLANEGRTIIIASHLLDEVQRICTDFAVLRMGEKIFQGRVDALSKENRELQINTEETEALIAFLGRNEYVADFRREGDRIAVTLKADIAISEFHQQIIDEGIVLNLLSPSANTLEQKFLQILKSSSHA